MFAMTWNMPCDLIHKDSTNQKVNLVSMYFFASDLVSEENAGSSGHSPEERAVTQLATLHCLERTPVHETETKKNCCSQSIPS